MTTAAGWLKVDVPELFINAEPGAVVRGRIRELIRTWPNLTETTVSGVHRQGDRRANIASLAGESPTPGLATYCASKSAVLGFTDSARIEHRNTGVRFSSVLPTSPTPNSSPARPGRSC
jgi:NAD(P)-dependent dehydrogenase (short-subunit alcohol dehydrogenase family)